MGSRSVIERTLTAAYRESNALSAANTARAARSPSMRAESFRFALSAAFLDREGRSDMIRSDYGRSSTSRSFRVSSAHTTPATAAPLTPATLVGDELQLVERRLAELLRSREERLTDIASYLIGSGGKRVRPAVTLLVFRACGGTNVPDIVDVAVALELIHSASLLHDDIIDGNQVRRGRASARRKYGVPETLVTGDFLFSRAFQICGRFDERLIHWAAEACIALQDGLGLDVNLLLYCCWHGRAHRKLDEAALRHAMAAVEGWQRGGHRVDAERDPKACLVDCHRARECTNDGTVRRQNRHPCVEGPAQTRAGNGLPQSNGVF
jgi:hypothetical protein